MTGDCGAGHWCVSGVDRKYPLSQNYTADNVTCYNWAELGYGGMFILTPLYSGYTCKMS